VSSSSSQSSRAVAATTSLRQRAPASRADRVTSLTGQVWTSDTRRSHSASVDTSSEESCHGGAHRERESSRFTTLRFPEAHEQRPSAFTFVTFVTCQGRRSSGCGAYPRISGFLVAETTVTLTVVWTSLGPLPRWVPGPTTRWAPGTTRLALHST
jgi:hypothetical protein